MRITWHRLMVWCAVGMMVTADLINPVTCMAAWVISLPAAGSHISNVPDCQMNGTGTKAGGTVFYKCRLYNTATDAMEGEGGATFMGGNWMGTATKKGVLQYTSGAASAEIWEFNGGAQNWKAKNAIIVN